MLIKIKYFGMIAEATGKADESFEFSDVISVGILNQELQQTYQKLSTISYQVAINKELIKDTSLTITSNDEIALLPPFAGG